MTVNLVDVVRPLLLWWVLTIILDSICAKLWFFCVSDCRRQYCCKCSLAEAVWEIWTLWGKWSALHQLKQSQYPWARLSFCTQWENNTINGGLGPGSVRSTQPSIVALNNNNNNVLFFYLPALRGKITIAFHFTVFLQLRCNRYSGKVWIEVGVYTPFKVSFCGISP